MGQYRPTSRRTHERQGRCTLCGTETTLTFTHLPPKAAFNTGHVRRSVYNENDEMVYDRGRDGGFGVWAHCDDCRRETSAWDDEYISWARHLGYAIYISPHKGQRGALVGTMATARPGRFARAALAGMTAVAEGLIDSHPYFVRDLRSGALQRQRGSLRFLAGVVSGAERPDSGGGHRGVAVTFNIEDPTRVTSAASRSIVSAYIHHFPFSLVLVDETEADRLPHRDCTEWLAMGLDEVVEPFRVDLPAVAVRSRLVATADAFAPTTI